MLSVRFSEAVKYMAFTVFFVNFDHRLRIQYLDV